MTLRRYPQLGTRLLLAAAIAAITLFTFRDAIHFEFLNWDDEPLLLQNTAYRGLGPDHLRWMFATTLGGHFQPLTWFSFAVDHALWELWSGGYHLTNVVLHAMNAVLVFRVVLQLLHARRDRTAWIATDASAIKGEYSGGGRRVEVLDSTAIGQDAQPHATGIALSAAFAALIFAMHPLRVESVAWITERRDVLSSLWLLLSLSLYMKHALATTPRFGLFAVSLGCFVLSLLAKATGMSIPFVLLALDVYVGRPRRGVIAGLALEKLVFGVPAAAAAFLALHAQRESGALWSIAEHSMPLRLAQACYGVMFYAWKTILPVNLSPLYEQPPDARVFDAGNIAGAAFLVVASLVAWRLRRRCPAIVAAWVCYLLLVSPVLGLAQSGPQLVADRYSYLACLPLTALLGGALASRLTANADRRRRPAWRFWSCGAGIVIVTLALFTQRQLAVWKDSESLWTAVLDRRPHTGLAHANLAAVLNQQGRHAEARRHAQDALAILPGNRTAHAALAAAALALGDPETAETHFRLAVEIARHVGKSDDASLHGLAQAFVARDRVEDAIDVYRSQANAAPRDVQWPIAAGTLLAQRDRLVESQVWLQRAVDAAPDSATAWLRLGVVRQRLGDVQQAVGAWNAGLEHVPNDPDLLMQLAWVLATTRDDHVRDPERAETIASQLLTRTDLPDPDRPWELQAAVLAASGDFAGAERTIETLLNRTAGHSDERTRARWEQQRSLYAAGQPLRE